MNATLCIPGEPPRSLTSTGFVMPNDAGYAQVPDRVAEEMACPHNVMDILDTGPERKALSTAYRILKSMCHNPFSLFLCVPQALLTVPKCPEQQG